MQIHLKPGSAASDAERRGYLVRAGYQAVLWHLFY